MGMMKEQRDKDEAKKPKPKPKPKKLTKKERMKAELMGHLAPGLDDAMNLMPVDDDKERRMLQQQSDNMFAQMIRRSKLPPTQEINLREFCDLVWRTGQASPLDEDEIANPRIKEEE